MPFGVIFSIGELLDVNQINIPLVVHLEVVGIERLALRAVTISLWDQLLGDHRVAYGVADLLLQVFRADVVGRPVEEHVPLVAESLTRNHLAAL